MAMRMARLGVSFLFFMLVGLCAGSVGAEAQTFNFQVCNQSGVSASVAVSGLTAVGSNQWNVEGWWTVPTGSCQVLGSFPISSEFYYYAEQTGASQNQWSGNALNLCVQYPGPFDRINSAGYNCQSSEALREFNAASIPSNEGTFTWTLNP
jgi:uncharacterized membrane protein